METPSTSFSALPDCAPSPVSSPQETRRQPTDETYSRPCKNAFVYMFLSLEPQGLWQRRTNHDMIRKKPNGKRRRIQNVK